jgi:hypothetical protein
MHQILIADIALTKLNNILTGHALTSDGLVHVNYCSSVSARFDYRCARIGLYPYKSKSAVKKPSLVSG